MELRPSAVLAGKLRLLRPLGQGGMGVVWAAHHLTLETEVAVKLIRPERVAADPALLARFEREARATARIAHPHVVQIMDYGTVDAAVPYIVMELLRGFSLAELLDRGGRLSFATARSLAEQVGSALSAAHERGVVHRDIKPHNVFITEGSKGYPLFVKVLDFGVAKMLGEAQVPGASAALTETGTVIGSPPYMSPEQLEGSKDVDLRSDLWSLGVILYEALTGALPFQGSSFVAVGAAVLKGKYRPASELRANLPAAVDDWFARALCVDPEGRFASAQEMVAAFAALDAPVTEVAARGPRGAGDRPGRAPGRRHREPRAAGEAPPEHWSPRGRTGAAWRCSPQRWGRSPWPERGCRPARGRRARWAAPRGWSSSTAPPSPWARPPRRRRRATRLRLHGVTVRAFCLDRTEVTVAAYAACEGCDPRLRSVEFEGLTPNGRTFESQFCNGPEAASHPINCVDWHQAKAYCAASGKRLPTEAEWELAARGEEGRTYPWGPAPPSRERLNACGSECSRMLTERREAVGKGPWPAMYGEDDSAPATSPVGRYPGGATPAGVLDLAGNVWEWTESPYCPYGKDDCGDSRRVLRGGGWDTTESQDVRAARRYPSAPTARGKSIGFRCAGAR